MTKYLAGIITANGYTGWVATSCSCNLLPSYKDNTSLIDLEGGINWQR